MSLVTSAREPADFRIGEEFVVTLSEIPNPFISKIPSCPPCPRKRSLCAHGFISRLREWESLKALEAEHRSLLRRINSDDHDFSEFGAENAACFDRVT
jgi:hypothetical protein